jgi:hypothetical protein
MLAGSHLSAERPARSARAAVRRDSRYSDSASSSSSSSSRCTAQRNGAAARYPCCSSSACQCHRRSISRQSDCGPRLWLAARCVSQCSQRRASRGSMRHASRRICTVGSDEMAARMARMVSTRLACGDESAVLQFSPHIGAPADDGNMRSTPAAEFTDWELEKFGAPAIAPVLTMWHVANSSARRIPPGGRQGTFGAPAIAPASR